MARIRTIKPDFFTSEDITERSPLARLLYVALWCEADREGRLVWKPKTFKLRYLPADECDIEQICQELLDANLIVTYGDGLAFIPTFSDHQHLNPREAASTLAPPNASATRRSRVKHASPPVPDAQVGREGKGREGEGKEGDLSSLRSDSSAPLVLTAVPPTEIRVSREARIKQIAEDFRTAFNSTLAKPNGVLSVCSVLNKPRLKAVEKCLPTARQMCKTLYGSEKITPEFCKAYFEEVEKDDWHSGRATGGPGHENWKPDFEYLLREGVMAKLFDRAMSSEEAA